jgi:hypothetical protein
MLGHQPLFTTSQDTFVLNKSVGGAIAYYNTPPDSYLFRLEYYNNKGIFMVKSPLDKEKKHYPVLEEVTFFRSCFPTGTDYNTVNPRIFANNFARRLDPIIKQVFGESGETNVFYRPYTLSQSLSRLILKHTTMQGGGVEFVPGSPIECWTMTIGMFVVVRG